MAYLFPIDIHFINSAERTAYAGDSGTDIGCPIDTPVVAVGDATVIYAEPGHTTWSTPPDTANSVKIRLDEPVVRHSNTYAYVFYTHLRDYVQRAKGSRVKTGDLLGHSGLGRQIPHLHITFYQSEFGGNYIESLDGQRMLWDEWLPAQLRPTLPQDEEEELIKVLPAIQDKNGNWQIIGAEVGKRDDKIATTFINARAPESVRMEVKVYVWPERGATIKKQLGKFLLANGRYVSFPITAEKLGDSGAFGVQLIPSNKAVEMWPSGVVERR